MRGLLIFICLALLLAAPARLYAADITGSKDHPLLARYPNSRIGDYKKNFNAVEFNVSWQGIETKSSLEGEVTELRYYYTNPEEQPSPLQLIRNYQNAAKAIGGEVLYDRKPADNDGGETTLRIIDKGKEYWIKVVPDIFSAPTQSYQLIVLERTAMTQVVKANKLLEEMTNSGFVTLYINFDTDSATLKPDSKPALAEVAKMLNSTPELRISIEGHTDNRGTPESNKTLSQNRANSVMRELGFAGVGTDRMKAVGFGQEKPVADNSTETGRSLNRRVELVKR